MSSEHEMEELQEAAEHGREQSSLAPVSFTMAILAVLVAVAALLSHRAHTEEVLLQNKATDQWAYYQAKNIRRHNDELFADLTTLVGGASTDALAKVRDKYAQEADRYKDEQTEIQNEARKLEQEFATERNRADRFDLAEVFLEVGLVITSITLLSGRRRFWHCGMVLAVVGIAASVTGLLMK